MELSYANSPLSGSESHKIDLPVLNAASENASNGRDVRSNNPMKAWRESNGSKPLCVPNFGFGSTPGINSGIPKLAHWSPSGVAPCIAIVRRARPSSVCASHSNCSISSGSGGMVPSKYCIRSSGFSDSSNAFCGTFIPPGR